MPLWIMKYKWHFKWNPFSPEAVSVWTTYFLRWKLNGLNASIFYETGRMIVYVVTSDVSAIYLFYIIFISFHFRVFFTFFFSLSLWNVGGAHVESLKRAFSWKFHCFYLSSDPFIFPQYVWHLVRFVVNSWFSLSFNSFHFVSFDSHSW